MAEGFAAADKSKPYIGRNSLANDRGYKDGKATATCLCGAVQLAFVSLSPECCTKAMAVSWLSLLYLYPNILQPPANRRPWSSQHLCLQLRGLSQTHRLYVRIQLHD